MQLFERNLSVHLLIIIFSNGKGLISGNQAWNKRANCIGLFLIYFSGCPDTYISTTPWKVQDNYNYLEICQSPQAGTSAITEQCSDNFLFCHIYTQELGKALVTMEDRPQVAGTNVPGQPGQWNATANGMCSQDGTTNAQLNQEVYRAANIFLKKKIAHD